MIKLSR
jgi:predicted 3-demethylubiquinone-9 3-methyltransferase (glyoxalase superfamily)